MKLCLPFLSFMKNCPENFGRQWGSKHELVQRVTGGVCDSASARTRSRDILFELTL